MSEHNTLQLDLDEILADIKPNYVTPHLDKVTSAPNNKKAKVISDLMMSAMVEGITDPVQKEILHDGKIHSVRYVNIEPLLNTPWSTISLILLNLSYGEQSTIIEAIYPARLQLNAKAFAVIFTPELQQKTITIHQDEQILEKLDSSNAGIAMILAILKKSGFLPHADEIKKSRQSMDDLVSDRKARDEYQAAHQKAQDAAKKGDLSR